MEEKELFAEKIGLYAFLLLGFLLPIFVLPFGVSLNSDKAYLAYFLILISFIAWVVAKIQSGKLLLAKNWILISLIPLLVVFFISAFFSKNSAISLFGLGGETNTWLSFAFISLAVFLSSQLLNRNGRILLWITLTLLSSLIVFIFQIIQTIFGITIFPVQNLIGSWNDFGIFWGFIGLASFCLYVFVKNAFFRFCLLAFFFFSLLILIFVNFKLLWLIFGVGLIILATHLFAAERSFRSSAFLPLIISLSFILFFLISPNLASTLTSGVRINIVDIRPSFKATFEIAKKGFNENPVLGSGPGTFAINWFKYKPAAINATPFWNFRFEQGASFFSTIPAETGVLGGLALLFFLGSIIFEISRAGRFFLFQKEPFLLFLSAISAFYYLFFSLLYSPNFLNILLGFIFLGIFTGLAVQKDSSREYQLNLFKESGPGFISGLTLIFFLLLSISGIYYLSAKYAAGIYFQKSVRAFAGGDLTKAKDNTAKALNLDAEPLYYRLMAQINLAELNQFSARTDLAPAEFRQILQNILSETIQNSQQAVNKAPNDILNIKTLAQIYEATIPLQISGASEAARGVLAKAALLFPNDPDIPVIQARIEIQAGNPAEARNFLEKSISLKSDYAAAHFLYSQLELQAGNIKAAIQRAEQAALSGPNDIGALFQLGLLYYQDKQYENSKIIFERIVSLNPNYSNARYFLGLIYDREGKTKKAVEEFQKIQTLNPENEEIKKILKNLKAGRPPLSEISPPEKKPEERKEPPIR